MFGYSVTIEWEASVRADGTVYATNRHTGKSMLRVKQRLVGWLARLRQLNSSLWLRNVGNSRKDSIEDHQIPSVPASVVARTEGKHEIVLVTGL
jgi:hypothetical protein